MEEKKPAVKKPAVKSSAGNTRDTLLKILCMAGEYPLTAQDLLPGQTNTSRQRTIYRMKESGIISIGERGGERSIRLYAKTKGVRERAKAFETIKQNLGIEYYEHYLMITNGHRFSGDKDKIQRRMRMAEVFAMFDLAGIENRPWELPEISIKEVKKLSNSTTGFYHSKVLKNIPSNDTLRVNYSRMCGLLLSPGGAYCVYSVHKDLINEAPGGEGKAQAFIKEVLLCNWNPPTSLSLKEDVYDAKQAIVFGGSHKVAKKLIEDTFKKRSPYMQLDGIYQDVYYVPTDTNGAFMLWMYTQENWRGRVLEGVIKKDLLEKYKGTRDYDILAPDGTQILAWFDSNLSTLRLVKKIMSVGDEKYMLLCFEWQMPIIRECLGDAVEIKTYPQERIERILKKGVN